MNEWTGGKAGAEHRAEHRDVDRGDLDDEISLRPYLEALWRYRRPIAAAPLVVAVVFAIVVLGVWLWSPTDRVASLQFRLLFEGAAQNRYPNDTPFSPTEIVGAPVVAAVFKANDLQRFGKYEDFKDALFVQQSNPELDLLAYEYQAKLADAKLTPVDRARIEAEFKSKREALLNPSFSLSLRRSERFTVLPRELAQKVLTDTLAAWAQQTEVRKGLLKYPVPILSSRVLSPASLDNDDYLVAADLLRTKAVRIIDAIDELQKIPGALTLRTASDVSLAEIRATLEDTLRLDLKPLLGIIRSEGIAKNPRLLSLYASNMVFQLRLDKQETEGRAQALQTSLREYMAQTAPRAGGGSEASATGGGRQGRTDSPSLMPQLSESFLDRLKGMSVLAQAGEMEYRRKLTDRVIAETRKVATFDKELLYYEDLTRALQGAGNRPAGTPEMVAMIKGRSQTALAVITKATNELSDFYTALSTHDLIPEARLYAITGPFTQQTTQPLTLGQVALAFALVMMLTLVLVPAACLVHNATRRKPAPETAPTA